MLSAPFALEGGRVVMAVGMNGRGPFLFMIDTGGVVSLVRDEIAHQLKLPVIGRSTLGGAGGTGNYAVYQANEFIIGNVWKQARVALVGTREMQYGPDIYGTMAAGLLTAADTELDFDASELRLYPDGRGDRPGFVRIPSHIRRYGGQEGSPYMFVNAALDGAGFDFVLDTGAPRSLVLNATAARRTTLWNDARPYAPYRPHGIGGMGPLGRLVRAGRLDFGGQMFDRPLVLLDAAGTGRGVLGDGIIGLPLMQRFNLSIGSRTRALWVQPSKRPAEPDRYALSGLWLEQKGDTPVVEAVGTGSPGAEAGVQVGDRILGEAIQPLIRRLAGPAGADVSLTLDRGGARRNVSLALRPYL